ncbi:MAG: metal-dependent hydrolase [Candidatus Levyibacteriota bacterium]
MTGRTHDLAAFTAFSYVAATVALPHISFATVIVSLSANLIGGLTPDIDQPTADLWHKFPAGTLIGKVLYPLLGGHRFLSHSILGIVLFGIGAKFLLQAMSGVLLVNMDIVWWSFMIGYISHLVMDTFTHEGVPWLFPIPVRFGVPPFKALRMKTGGIIEKSIVFPGLMILTGYIYYAHYAAFVHILKAYIQK